MHNPNVKIEYSPAQVKVEQKPLTKFIDWLDAIDVRLLDWSDPLKSHKVGFIAQQATWKRTLHDVIKLSDAKTELEIQQAIKESAKGESLPLNLEMIHFTFLVGGISRIATHQIVRTRVGITYSQRCSGDQDIRHDDVLVPRDIAADKDAYQEYINQVLQFKNWYATYADEGYKNGTHSVQTLRYLAPHNLSQFIIVSGSLLAFAGIIGKRMCSCETIEYNKIASEYARLICEKFPTLTDFLKADCNKSSGCYHMKSHSPWHGNIYLPDFKHDFDYNKKNFMYPFTRNKMVEDFPAVATKFYVGQDAIDEENYLRLLNKYEQQ